MFSNQRYKSKWFYQWFRRIVTVDISDRVNILHKVIKANLLKILGEPLKNLEPWMYENLFINNAHQSYVTCAFKCSDMNKPIYLGSLCS